MADLILLYTAGKQLAKVRLIMYLSLVCAAGGIVWAVDLAQTYGTAPGDGGVLAPLPVRLAWAIGVGMLGVIFAAAMDAYGRHYITRVQFGRQQNLLYIDTLRWWGRATQIVPPNHVSGGGRHSGRFTGGDIEVNAPWVYLWVRGNRWAMILDLQGEILTPELAQRLLKI